MSLYNFKNHTKQINDRTFTLYYNHLAMISKVMFKWSNLPHSIDEKWVEKYLFEDGKCVIFKDEMLGWMVARCNVHGKLNVHGEPVQVQPYGIGYTHKPLTIGKDCIFIRNNDDMIPTYHFVIDYAWRLANITRTIDVNINAQKTPNFIACGEKQRLSLKNIFRQWNENEPLIVGDKTLEGLDFMKVLDIEAPIVFPQLQIQKQTIFNEFLTMIGMNNANTEKRERLISNEVDANNEHITYAGDVYLKARERACEELKRVFDLDVTVERREQHKAEKEGDVE